MSMNTLERAVWKKAKEVFANPKLRLKDLLEWSTGKVEAEAGEVVAKLPGFGVNVCVKKEHDKRTLIGGVK